MPMPKELQIHTLKRIFKAYNKNSDPQAIDWSVIDGTLELPENMGTLRETYSQFCWSKHDVKVGTEVMDIREIEYHSGQLSEERRLTKFVTIRSHRIKSKGRTYERGRIQISTTPKFIGCRARVEVEVFVPEEIDTSNNEEFEEIFEEDI